MEGSPAAGGYSKVSLHLATACSLLLPFTGLHCGAAGQGLGSTGLLGLGPQRGDRMGQTLP